MSVEDDAALLRRAALAAGKLAMDFFGRDLEVRRKAGDEPVSDADLAVEALLEELLREPRPDYGWLSEEGDDNADRLSRARVWVVDPIDGTRAYLRGSDEFAVSAALVEGGRPILGAVYRPARDELYFAAREQGATLDGKPIRVVDAPGLKGCRMIADARFFRNARHWPVPWPEMRYEGVSSIALRLALVASGMHDAAVTVRSKHDWDLAAGDLIVHEAGGRVVDERGRALVYNRRRPVQPCAVAAPPALLPPLLARVRPAVEAYRARSGRTRL